MNEWRKMKTTRSFLVILTSVIVVLLVIAAGIWPLFGGNRTFMQGRPTGQFGQMRGNPPTGGQMPNSGNFQPGFGNGQTSRQNSSGNNYGMNWGSDLSTSLKLMQLLRFGVSGAVIFFGLLAVLGIFLMRKWGKVLTIITGAIVLAYTLPNLFRFMGGNLLFEGLIKVILAVAAVVLVFLPDKRSPVQASTPSTSAL
jgi:hypothetical protein